MAEQYGTRGDDREGYEGRSRTTGVNNRGDMGQSANTFGTSARIGSGYESEGLDFGSARSDYGSRAYGGRLNKKGLESGSPSTSRRQGAGRSSGRRGGKGKGLMVLGGLGAGAALLYAFGAGSKGGGRRLFSGRGAARKCGEVMTRDPACCLPTDTAERAAQLMKAENVGPVPVVTDHQTKRLIGIVTDRDLAIHVVAGGRDARGTRVEEVMTKGVVACRADDDLQKALDAMSEHQVRRIPVVDVGDRIVGIIAQADVATRVKQPRKTAEVVGEISRSSAAGRL